MVIPLLDAKNGWEWPLKWSIKGSTSSWETSKRYAL
jgi:hypothetical protein